MFPKLDETISGVVPTNYELTCQNCHTHWRSSSMLTHISHTSICIFCHKSFQIILNWAKTKEEGSVNDQRLWLWEDDIGKMWEYWSEVQGSVGSPSHHLHPSIIHSCQSPTCGDPGDCCSLLRFRGDILNSDLFIFIYAHFEIMPFVPDVATHKSEPFGKNVSLKTV